MITLLRNCRVFAPAELGKIDILIAGRRIAAMAESLPRSSLPAVVEVDCAGRS